MLVVAAVLALFPSGSAGQPIGDPQDWCGGGTVKPSLEFGDYFGVRNSSTSGQPNDVVLAVANGVAAATLMYDRKLQNPGYILTDWNRPGPNSYGEVEIDGVVRRSTDFSPATSVSRLTIYDGMRVIMRWSGCGQATMTWTLKEAPLPAQTGSGSGGFIVGDPQFVGLRGQTYQVHGVAGEVYNIVSDADLQYNSRFVFLDSGACPVVKGKRQKGCFSHPGSYLGELGLKTRAGDRIRILAGGAQHGLAGVLVNEKAVPLGETVMLASDLGSVSFNASHLASVQVGVWNFAFENSDHFVNQRVRVLGTPEMRSHGLLGQTWNDATYPNAVKHIAGQVDDYAIRDGDIFGDSFVFNAFN